MALPSLLHPSISLFFYTCYDNYYIGVKQWLYSTIIIDINRYVIIAHTYFYTHSPSLPPPPTHTLLSRHGDLWWGASYWQPLSRRLWTVWQSGQVSGLAAAYKWVKPFESSELNLPPAFSLSFSLSLSLSLPLSLSHWLFRWYFICNHTLKMISEREYNSPCVSYQLERPLIFIWETTLMDGWMEGGRELSHPPGMLWPG